MSDDAFVREFQRRAGLVPDGDAGPKTMAALNRVLPADRPRGGLTRIIWHWTAGAHVVTSVDRAHYHYIIGGDGSVVPGDHVPQDNISTADGAYAAHTLNCNTGAIGVAVAGMMGARERPWDAGAFPIREPQISALIALTADLCRRHGIDVGPTTTLSHAEVQPTLGITQRGKWDITWLPGMIGPGDPVAVGNVLRGRVLAHMRAGS